MHKSKAATEAYLENLDTKVKDPVWNRSYKILKTDTNIYKKNNDIIESTKIKWKIQMDQVEQGIAQIDRLNTTFDSGG